MEQFISSIATAALAAGSAVTAGYLSLKHQSESAKEQRQFEQRRLEYARFIEGISRVIRDLSSATDLSPSKISSSAGLMEFSESSGRLSLFASPTVLEIAIPFTQEVTTFTYTLFGFVIRSMEVQSRIASTKATIEHLESQEGELRTVIREQRSGPESPDFQRWKRISDSLLSSHDDMVKFIREKSTIQLEAMRTLFTEYQRLAPACVKLITAMRADLAYDDAGDVSNLMNNASKSAAQNIEEFLKQVEDAVNKTNT